MVDGFLNGKRFDELAKAYDLSVTRVRQIIEKADRLVGGGILTEVKSSSEPGRADYVVAYSYVWSLAKAHGLSGLTPHSFFRDLQRCGSLEKLVDRMKEKPERAPAKRELVRLVWLRETGKSPWPAPKPNGVNISSPKSAADHPHRALECQEAIEPGFRELVGRAGEAGWTGDEIALALLQLAGAHIMARAANHDTDRVIAAAKVFRNFLDSGRSGVRDE